MGKGLAAAKVFSGSFAVITVATLAYFLAVGLMIPVIPRYVKGPLGGGSIAIGAAVGAFSVASVLVRPFIGGLGDRTGRRRLILTGPVLVAGAVALYPVAHHSLALLMALRFVQGAGEACFYVGAASAVTDLAPPERRAEAVSYFSVALYLGLAIGPALGETVLHHTHFGRVWALTVFFALAATAVGVLFREPARVVAETPATPRRLVHPAGLRPGAVLGFGMLGYAGFAAFVPLYASQLGLSGAGTVFLLYAAVTVLLRVVGARLPDRIGPGKCALVANCWLVAALAVMGTWNSSLGLYVATGMFATGVALNFPSLLSLAVDAAPESERGSVVGTFTAFFDLGQAVGAVSLGAVAAAAGYQGAFLAGSLSSAVGLAVLISYLRTRRATVHGHSLVDDVPAEPAL